MSTYDMTGKPFNFATLVDDVTSNEAARRETLAASGEYFAVRVLARNEWGRDWVTLPAVRGLEAAEAIQAAYQADEQPTEIVVAADR